MATVRERKPGMWEVRAFTGPDECGRPTQVSRTVRGTKKDVLRVAAELTVRPVTRAASATVAELLAQWVEQNEATWAASTRRDNPGRAAAILADPLAKMPISRVAVADIERWHTGCAGPASAKWPSRTATRSSRRPSPRRSAGAGSAPTPWLRPVFVPLRDPDYFAQVRVDPEAGTVGEGATFRVLFPEA
jgi:hypothetical protein